MEIVKDYNDVRALHKRIRELENKLLLERETNELLRDLVNRDFLTGAPNRRALEEFVERTGKKGTAILLLDIDNFKHVNDTYGHEVGDEVLKAATQFLRTKIRGRDILSMISRWGGEEFLLALPEATSRQIFNRFYNAKRGEAELSFVYAEGENQLFISFSGGITDLGDDPDTLQAGVARADCALYIAKESGRNRIVLAA